MPKKSSKKQKKLKGFTVTELLAIIAVVGILALIALTALAPTRAKARDGKRISELNHLRNALQLYYMDKGRYPIDPTGAWCSLDAPASEPHSCVTVLDELSSYLPSTPSDPLFGKGQEPDENILYSYQYISTSSGGGYKLHTDLEKTPPYYYELASYLGSPIAYAPGGGGGGGGGGCNPNFVSHALQQIPPEYATYDFEAIDLDEDGDLDLIAPQSYTEPNYWYENDGAENFNLNMVYADNFDNPDIEAIDLDEDGDIDLVAAHGVNNAVNDEINYWYENDGTENFTAIQIHPTAWNTNAVEVIDLDEDGDLDILTADGGGPGGPYQVNHWYENNGSEIFTEHNIHVNSAWTTDIRAVDIDKDGDLDIVTADRNQPNTQPAHWYENNGSEIFTQHNIYEGTEGYYLDEIVAIDLDEDGDWDLVGAAGSGEGLWYENNGSQVFTAHEFANGDPFGLDVDIIDLDEDGNLDIIMSSFEADDHNTYWYQNDGSQNFTRLLLLNSNPNFYNLTDIKVIDLDEDGDLDLISSHWWVAGVSNYWHENIGCP